MSSSQLPPFGSPSYGSSGADSVSPLPPLKGKDVESPKKETVSPKSAKDLSKIFSALTPVSTGSADTPTKPLADVISLTEANIKQKSKVASIIGDVGKQILNPTTEIKTPSSSFQADDILKQINEVNDKLNALKKHEHKLEPLWIKLSNLKQNPAENAKEISNMEKTLRATYGNDPDSADPMIFYKLKNQLHELEKQYQSLNLKQTSEETEIEEPEEIVIEEVERPTLQQYQEHYKVMNPQLFTEIGKQIKSLEIELSKLQVEEEQLKKNKIESDKKLEEPTNPEIADLQAKLDFLQRQQADYICRHRMRDSDTSDIEKARAIHFFIEKGETPPVPKDIKIPKDI